MSSYLKGARSARTTPEIDPIFGREAEMVENEAGGYAFQVGSLERLRRWLILGSEGGTYYADERRHTRKNVQALEQALREDGDAAVDLILEVQRAGRAAKPDQAIFALAYAGAFKVDGKLSERALRAVPEVLRTGYQLFMFLEFLTELRGWGARPRKAVAAWYQQRDVGRLAYQMVKYRQRGGWTHRRAINVSHPKPPTAEHEALYQWAKGMDPALVDEKVVAFEWAQLAETPADTAKLIRQRPWLPREALRTEHTTDPEVWKAMLENRMPMHAMLRNLGRMTSYGVLTPMADETDVVARALTDQSALTRARVHPVAILNALATYKIGRGHRTSWRPVRGVVDALDEAFYLSWGNVTPAGKRTLLAIDVSGSMVGHAVVGMDALSARDAAAAMALVIANTERRYEIVAFASRRTVTDYSGRLNPDYYDPRSPQDYEVRPLDISPRQRIADAVEVMAATPAGGTDVSLPMLYAQKRALDVDTFVVLTDNESYRGAVHPSQALRHYRQSTGIRDARLVVVAFTATDYSVADPRDAGMLDVVGFDTAAPDLISAFSRGEV